MKFEDELGRTIFVLVFIALLALDIRVQIGSGLQISLEEIGSFLNIAFCSLMVFFTLIRLPPKSSAAGLEPRVAAILGTFILLLLPIAPLAPLPGWLATIATLLEIAGFALAIYCLVWLGRSFSIMASARKLVVSGPYSFVRHPLYLSESLFVASALIFRFSPLAIWLVGIQVFFQYRRIRNEEAILRKTFTTYEAYAARVPMLVPGSRLVQHMLLKRGQC